jgi:FAD:protein FMN transferase
MPLRLSYLGLLCALVLVGCRTAPPAAELKRFEFAQPHMGTLWQITLYAADSVSASNAVQAAFARVAALDRMMTDYDPESELMRLSKTPPGVPFPLSADLLAILLRSRQLYAQSRGAFDITVGPSVQLWRRARRQRALPGEENLAKAKACVGFGNLRIDAGRRTATLLREGMRLDLGGIAKGYGADAALRVLRERGIRRALVAASGDLALGDPPPGKSGWRVGIGTPEAARTNLARLLLLRNCGVSTSGDTEQFVELGGVRYGHIVDPRTGRALTNRIQATVIAPNTTTSDVLATSVCVLGVREGLRLIDEHAGLSACIITRDSVAAGGAARKTRRPEDLLPLVRELGAIPGTTNLWLIESRRFPSSN